ncbi:hypothetical protein EJ08DRAFT_293765 [Tothia fuscella]|uniref:Uncharacterized protein n=1 Tax=Tothia fuscella TaxID=1048955 RepID=A0A9P4U3F8_9PEZI|nr:hypothetical protein EJ08DRAFT_293765 [Tothia fuscella]
MHFPKGIVLLAPAWVVCSQALVALEPSKSLPNAVVDTLLKKSPGLDAPTTLETLTSAKAFSGSAESVLANKQEILERRSIRVSTMIQPATKHSPEEPTV